MVEVDRVCVEDVVSVDCRGVYLLVEFVGVEGGVVVVADSEENRVKGCRL